MSVIRLNKECKKNLYFPQYFLAIKTAVFITEAHRMYYIEDWLPAD